MTVELPRENVEVLDDPLEPTPQLPETDQASAAAGGSAQASAASRDDLLARIRRSRTLPKGLRDRLCEYVQTLQFSEDAPEVPVVPVAEAVAMIEAAIPEHLQLSPEELESPAHPRGEGFFSRTGEAISDADADRIAAEQLAATGFAAKRS